MKPDHILKFFLSYLTAFQQEKEVEGQSPGSPLASIYTWKGGMFFIAAGQEQNF
jgi:hypothetical protein